MTPVPTVTPAAGIVGTCTASTGTGICTPARDLPAPCPPQAPHEPTPEYRARVLRYALAHGLAWLDLAQLDQADRAAQISAASLPMKLDPAAARYDARLHDLRLQIASRLRTHRTRWEAIGRELSQLTPSDPEKIAPGRAQPAQTPESDADLAARLLKAALILIMGQGDDRQGGQRARLIPPRPTKPSGGTTLAVPTAQRITADDIAF